MEKIFSTKERMKILKSVIFKERQISVNNIAAQIKTSKGLVSKYFNLLVKEGVAKRSNGKYLVINSAVTKGIKILLNIAEVNVSLFKKYDFVKAVGLYGSCAKGENNEESDIDLWIRVADVDDERISLLTAELSKKIRNVKLIFLTTNKIKKMKEIDQLFYHSLVFGSIIIYGGKDGIQL